VQLIKKESPNWRAGGAVAIRYINKSKNLRLSQAFVAKGEERAPNGRYVLFAQAPNSGEAWFVLTSRVPLTQGHFECNDRDIALATAFTLNFKGGDPETAWTNNKGGSCELDIYKGNKPGDLAGKLSAVLVANKGEIFFAVEAGYFYLKAASRLGGAPPSSPPTAPKLDLPR
jgi:hypothetical protein